MITGITVIDCDSCNGELLFMMYSVQREVKWIDVAKDSWKNSSKSKWGIGLDLQDHSYLTWYGPSLYIPTGCDVQYTRSMAADLIANNPASNAEKLTQK